MKFIEYISNLAMPFTILIILVYGIIEKKKVFDIFLNGAKEGLEIVLKMFPTLIGLFVAIGALRYSGILDFIIRIIYPAIKFLGIPKEIMPLAILRPISRKCINSNRKRYYEIIWGRYKTWFNGIYNNGINRDNFIYNCGIYKCCWNKKN